MTDPVIVPRADHAISRRDIDSDALRVLHRLQQNGHVAYLVGGSVRDLMLGRRPKDFDIGTDAHPYQIKRLFRNCWIIGRRFRLAHIKFGEKTIEVATFRKNVPDATAETPAPPEPEAQVVAQAAPEAPALAGRWVPADHHTSDAMAGDSRGPSKADAHGIVHRDNTFGTPEEDAFRRDFTVNALFYDANTKSVIDYVGGLGDLEQRIIRSIGDPHVRFVEDPVRMLRAAVLGARLGFDMDVLVIEAIAEQRGLITKAAPARLLEEYYKILRSGCAEASFRALGRVRLLELITPELESPPEAVWESLGRLDRYRQRFPSAPPEMTTAILMGSLLSPLGTLNRRMPDRGTGEHGDFPERVNFGILPVARKDVDRLRQIQQLLPRMLDPNLPPRVVRGLPHRPSFADALTWLEIFGDDPEAVERWKRAYAERPQPRPHGHAHPHGRGQAHGHGHPPHAPSAGAAHAGGGVPKRRRRRRRRGGRGRGPGGPAGNAAP